MVPVAMRVARNPLLEGHLALHIHRVVLNVNKCLMGLQNTVSHLMKIGLRGEWRWPKPDKCFGAMVSTPFKTELRPLIEHRSVDGARFPHSCRRRSSQLQSHVMTHVTASPYPAVTGARNVHKGGSRHMRHPASHASSHGFGAAMTDDDMNEETARRPPNDALPAI